MKRIVSFILLLVGSYLQAQPNQGLLGEYFYGDKFGKKVATQIDKQINFHWDQHNKPVNGLGENYFSVRWTGQLYTPEAGMYYFSVTADDGAKIWVNGVLTVDAWEQSGHPKTRTTEYVTGPRNRTYLPGKQWIDIKVEYKNAWAKADMVLYWETPYDIKSDLGSQGLFRKIIPAKYLSPQSKTPPIISASSRQSSIQRKPALSGKASAKPSSNPTVNPAPGTSAPIETVRLEKGKTIILQQVQFAQSSYVLLPESFPTLDRLVTTLKEKPSQRIEISGHTDNVGDARLNITLSEYRAKQVANYLINRGIPVDQIATKGYGGQRPIASNNQENERAKNRRVEILAL